MKNETQSGNILSHGLDKCILGFSSGFIFLLSRTETEISNLVARLVGGHYHRSIIEHGLTAFCMGLLANGLCEFFIIESDSDEEYQEFSRRKLSFIIVFVYIVLLLTVELCQTVKLSREFQWEQLGGTGVGLASSLFAIALLELLRNSGK
ncbi:MAG: hypothetical protein PVJ09_00370 [Candidatus Woesebacteria bacterium]|jgi:hypothetical protein